MTTRSITPTQSLLSSYRQVYVKQRTGPAVGYPRFVKPGEAQDKAIKRLMTAIKRKPACKSASDFPTWRPGDTTASYVEGYLGKTAAEKFIDMERLGRRPAPYSFEPDVVFELVTDEVSA